jgi:hypothetical protein
VAGTVARSFVGIEIGDGVPDICNAFEGGVNMKGSSGPDKRRKQPRHDYVTTVKYLPGPLPGSGEVDAYTLNMSGNGLCLSVKKPLDKEQEIIVTDCILSVLRRRYRVRWIKQSEKHHAVTYIAGLSACDDSGEEASPAVTAPGD